MRVLQSVGSTMARPGESVQDVLDRAEWGESGPFYGRAEYLVKKLADAEFCADWNKEGKTPEQLSAGAPERLKFVVAAQEILGLVFDCVRKGDVAKARKYIEVFNDKLNIPFELNEEGTLVSLPIPGRPRGLEWPVGPNLPD